MAQDMEQLYRRHYQTVYRYALRLTGSEHAAEELAAETFYRAMVALPDFRGECAASTWLCQIARNTWTSLRRKEGRCQPLDDTAALPDSRDFAAAFEDKDLALRIHRLLHRLPEPYREVFLLRVLGELSFRDIGSLFEKGENWACVTYHRARKKIMENGGNAMKTIDCALAQDLMPLYTEGMLSPESREALEEHLAGCEACRRTADEMCHPLLEPQFQEEARLLRRLRRRRKALWAAVIVLTALLVLSGILWYAEARYTAQALTPRLTRLSIPSQAVQESYTAEDGSVVIQKAPNQKYLYYFLLRSSSKDIPLKLTEGKVYGFYDGQLYQLNAQFYIRDTSKGVLPLGYESGVEFSDQVINGWLNPLPAQGQQLELVMVLDEYPDYLDQPDQFLLELTYQPAGFAASLLPDGDTAPRTVRLWSE